MWLWTAGGRLVIDGSYVAPATGCMRRMRCPSAREDDVLVGPPRRTERRFPRAAASLASGADALSSPIVCIVCGRRTYILYVCVYICGHDSLQRLGRNEAEMGANRAVRADALAGHSRRRNRAAGGRTDGMDGMRAGSSECPRPCRVVCQSAVGHRSALESAHASQHQHKCPSCGVHHGMSVDSPEEEMPVVNASKGNCPPAMHRRGNARINASKRECPSSTH